MSMDHLRHPSAQRMRIEVRAVRDGRLLEATDVIATPTRQAARVIANMCDLADITHGTRTYAVCVACNGQPIGFDMDTGKIFSKEGRAR